VATSEENKDSTRKRKDHVLGQDEKKYAFCISTIQLHTDRLQNLRQGNRSVDDYTMEFYELVSRDAIAEDEESRVARYIGGLRIQFQDVLYMFDTLSVSDAHQRAVQLEK